MTHDELRQLVAQVRSLRSEQADVAVKAAKGGTLRRSFEG